MENYASQSRKTVWMISLVIKFTPGLACYNWNIFYDRYRTRPPRVCPRETPNFTADHSRASMISLIHLHLVSIIVLSPLSTKACTRSRASMLASSWRARRPGAEPALFIAVTWQQWQPCSIHLFSGEVWQCRDTCHYHVRVWRSQALYPNSIFQEQNET